MRVKRLLSIISGIVIIALAGTGIDSLASSGASATLNEIVSGEESNATGETEGESATGVSDGDAENAVSTIRSLPAALSCTFILPDGFQPSDTPGVYVNEFYPLESANVTYKVSNIPQEKELTNAQKAAGESADASEYEMLYNELTAEKFEELQRNSYEALYGVDPKLAMWGFEKREFDGFPGYVINTAHTLENTQTIRQVTVIILSSNKVFTVVYSRADDDDFEDDINQSLETIHVIRK
ncbi:hypothetical protein [Butyrivibrio sp. XPD2002]|uniref:hypothetical protein n=1 Tax=Butyrivibrio sp. XPD2002 TaxID=1280665 RepID=UPI0012DBFBD5|nr:hypothetical protein [Butyrivibrio sp. XPD2002]